MLEVCSGREVEEFLLEGPFSNELSGWPVVVALPLAEVINGSLENNYKGVSKCEKTSKKRVHFQK